MIQQSDLENLIKIVNQERVSHKFKILVESDYRISYIPTKKTSFVGYKQGYAELLYREQKGIKESEKMRANTKNYLKVFRDESGFIAQIETYRNGRIDCVHQGLCTDSKSYLFPYSADGGYYPTYVFVTEFRGERTAAEYMVDGNQIIYEMYEQEDESQVSYEFINYVSGGTYPVLGERKGRFLFNPLRFVIQYEDNWLNHR